MFVLFQTCSNSFDRNLFVVNHCGRHCLKVFVFVAHLDEVRWILCFTLNVCVQSKLLEHVPYLNYYWSYLHQTCKLWYLLRTRQDEPYSRMLEVNAFRTARYNVLGADARWWPYLSNVYLLVISPHLTCKSETFASYVNIGHRLRRLGKINVFIQSLRMLIILLNLLYTVKIVYFALNNNF